MSEEEPRRDANGEAAPGDGTGATANASALADWLVAQHCTRARFGALPEPLRPRTVAAAYAAQDAFVEAKSRDCGPAIGWKIALSNPVMRRFVGLSEPVSGRMHERQVVGSPARTRARDYGRLLLEFEIAVEIGADLPPRAAAYDRAAVAQAVVAVRPAIELADDRHAEYGTLAPEALQLIADNAWNEGAVLGQRRADWRGLDLSTLRGAITLDGEPAGEGVGSDLMGHPLDALAWLVTNASRRGRTVRAGDVVILGSLVTSKMAQAGQRWEYVLDGFAPVVLSVD